MKTFEINVKRTVSREDVDFVLDAALSGGPMADWCESADIGKKPTEENYGYTSEVLTRGGTLLLTDREDENVYELTLDKFLEAIGKVGIDFDNYDSVDADMVVQTAIFGEVVYG